MGHKIAWFGEIKGIVRHFSIPEQVEIDVRLTEGVPVRQSGRTVRVRMTPERALDWSAELASQARNVRRRNVDYGSTRYTAPRGENLTRYVGRLLRNFAEDTGAQDDGLDSQVLDLTVELLKIAARDGVDIDQLADKARQEAWEAENDLYNRYDRVGKPRPTA